MPPLYMASSFINQDPRAWRQNVVQAPIEESCITGLEFVRDLECNVACASAVSMVTFSLGAGLEGRLSDFGVAPLAAQGAALSCEVLLPLPAHEDAAEDARSCPGHEDPADFMGRLLELGDVVETLRMLYRSQGEDVRVAAGWRGVLVKLDGSLDALVDFGEGRGKKWIRRKHLGTLKKPEEHELQHSYSSPGSSLNASFHSVSDDLPKEDGLWGLDDAEVEPAKLWGSLSGVSTGKPPQAPGQLKGLTKFLHGMRPPGARRNAGVSAS